MSKIDFKKSTYLETQSYQLWIHRKTKGFNFFLQVYNTILVYEIGFKTASQLFEFIHNVENNLDDYLHKLHSN